MPLHKLATLKHVQRHAFIVHFSNVAILSNLLNVPERISAMLPLIRERLRVCERAQSPPVQGKVSDLLRWRNLARNGDGKSVLWCA